MRFWTNRLRYGFAVQAKPAAIRCSVSSAEDAVLVTFPDTDVFAFFAIPPTAAWLKRTIFLPIQWYALDLRF
jgi:hypothetical protein